MARGAIRNMRPSRDLVHAERAREKAIESLVERAKNELRDATATRASERVGELRLAGRAEAGRVRPSPRRAAWAARISSKARPHNLTTQTSTLVTALRNPASRGKWGEMQLRNVVEKAGMLAHCDFSEQQTVALEEARVRPDMTVNLPGERCVFVDAKAPIDAMQAALEAVDDEAPPPARQTARARVTRSRRRARAARLSYGQRFGRLRRHVRCG